VICNSLKSKIKTVLDDGSRAFGKQTVHGWLLSCLVSSQSLPKRRPHLISSIRSQEKNPFHPFNQFRRQEQVWPAWKGRIWLLCSDEKDLFHQLGREELVWWV
jgi:hypothetical protein